MSYKQLKKRTEGFTIIEVLIVIAIAGLILLIVFRAVPALQRNARNNDYKSQAATYAGAVSEWQGSKNGAVVNAAAVAEINSLAADGKLTEPTALTAGAQTGDPAIGTLQLQVGVKCDPASYGDTTASGATSRNVAVRYSIENSSGGPVKQCIDAN